MAGAGYKLFNTGDVLTAAQVNTYLQEQAVMRFANATARTTALSGVLAEGMVSYLDDTNKVQVYNGSAWVDVAGDGDITGITTGATSGLTGGVTSGTADLKLNTSAKGALLVGTGSGTVTELLVGTNNHVLTADSSTASGLKWAAAAGGGKVLQVVMGTYSTEVSSSTTTYVDTGLSASITPSATSSKVLVMVAQNGHNKDVSDTGSSMKLFRGTTEIAYFAYSQGFLNNTGHNSAGTTAINYLDTPSTTSSITYKTQFMSFNNTARVRYQQNSTTSTIILMEIGA